MPRLAVVQTIVQSDNLITVTAGQIPVLSCHSAPENVSLDLLQITMNFLRIGVPAVQLIGYTDSWGPFLERVLDRLNAIAPGIYTIENGPSGGRHFHTALVKRK